MENYPFRCIKRFNVIFENLTKKWTTYVVNCCLIEIFEIFETTDLRYFRLTIKYIQ